MRGFSMLADWKGKHFWQFTLIYGLPILLEFCKLQPIIENFTRFANLIFLLSQDKIGEIDIRLAEIELNAFKKSYFDIYGISNNVPNMHELVHIIDSVKRSGPLWVNSTFWFEGLNHQLKKFVRSSLRPDLQIMRR